MIKLNFKRRLRVVEAYRMTSKANYNILLHKDKHAAPWRIDLELFEHHLSTSSCN
jgi:hypothetical protein